MGKCPHLSSFFSLCEGLNRINYTLDSGVNDSSPASLSLTSRYKAYANSLGTHFFTDQRCYPLAYKSA